MIEGVKIDIPSDELKSHLTGRVEYHKGKERFYRNQAQVLKDGGAGTIAMSNDPVSSLQGSQRQHSQQAAFFQFMAEHIVPDETYRLSESDFSRLEFSSRYF